MTYDETFIIEAIHRPEGEQGSEDAGWEIDFRFSPESSEGHWVGVTDESLGVIVGEAIAQMLIADRERQTGRDVTVEWETDGQTVDLPSTVRVPRNVDDEGVANWLSDKYDWLVLGWAEA